MAMDDLLAQNIRDCVKTVQGVAGLSEPLNRAVELVVRCIQGGGKVLICGNGGSAADAGHLATEFIARFEMDRRPFAAIALTESGSAMTAICNDYGFEQVFARQIRGLAKTGDVVIAITTSGKSKNVLAALETAREMGIGSIAFLGKGGGFTRGVATVDLLVSSDVTARVQEAHLVLYHTLCQLVERELAGGA